ncbi:MAG: class I SAM-dependent methyltransferase [Parvularculales bacterium]
MLLKDKLRNQINAIVSENRKLGFDMSCDMEVAELCANLASIPCHKHLLEIGTGTGISTLFIAQLMSQEAELITIDIDATYSQVAQTVLEGQKNVRFIVEDAGTFLKKCERRQFSFIFADAWPGKYSNLNHALRTLDKGGLYIIDDLLPQSNWPDRHGPRVDALLEVFRCTDDFSLSYMNWSSGVAIITKTGNADGIENDLVKDPEFSFLFSEDLPQ